MELVRANGFVALVWNAVLLPPRISASSRSLFRRSAGEDGGQKGEERGGEGDSSSYILLCCMKITALFITRVICLGQSV